MTTPKPALPEPVPPNAEGSTTCIVRWMVTTRDGLWLGAWDKEAFAAYTQSAIAAAVAEVNALNGALTDKCNSYIIANARLAEQVAEARAVPEWPCACDEQGRGEPGVTCGDCPRDYGHCVTPSPVEQSKPAVLDELLAWAVSRWESEVRHRPLVNKNRRSLDDTWRQVIRFAGGDPDALLGPAHDALLAALQGEPHDQA